MQEVSRAYAPSPEFISSPWEELVFAFLGNRHQTLSLLRYLSTFYFCNICI